MNAEWFTTFQIPIFLTNTYHMTSMPRFISKVYVFTIY